MQTLNSQLLPDSARKPGARLALPVQTKLQRTGLPFRPSAFTFLLPPVLLFPAQWLWSDLLLGHQTIPQHHLGRATWATCHFNHWLQVPP